ncbi:MAG: UvrD-helicase domain-containing protein [Bacteroidales bacterium]|nr:UvrD-helicase domain-containing protein [Bacteroidales bacterium]
MKLNIYKASAGSGKTYNLACNYIVDSFGKKAPSRSGTSLYEAFRDTMAFARILAVTFTNKAAGEMKERILQEFDKLATGQKSDYVDAIIKRYPQYNEQQVRERARSIRSAILHNYSDFNLRTIDSFVQRVVRAFCYDINVSTGFSTQTDQNMVLNDLIEILLKKSDDDPELRKQFLAMAEKNVKDGNNWDFREQMRQLAKLIFTEQFSKVENFYRDMSEETKREFYQASLELINTIYDGFEQEADSIAKETKLIFDNIGTPASEIGKNMGTLYNFLTDGIRKCQPGVTVEKMQEGNGWTNAKPTPIQKELVPQIRPALELLLARAMALVSEKGTDYLTAKVIRKDFHAFTLLGDLARLMPEYRRENRMMLVSDATAFLNAIVEGNDAPFIYERVGNKFDHVYIDEFQDTSEFQWNNFRPLIENSLAQGFNNMIVGDVKQAIYRFRGGDWSLLNSKVEEQIGADSISQHTLDVNWRSRRNIVLFNDAIFQKSVAMLGQYDHDGLDLSMLEKIYSDSYQKLPASKDRTGGKVKVVFMEASEDNSDGDDSENAASDNSKMITMDGLKDFEVMALNTMAREIDSLMKSGVKPKKICILVRKGLEGNKCVNFLMLYQQQVEDAARYDIVSSDALYICNSLTVSVLANAMKYINNHDDIIAKVEMMRAYCLLSGKAHTDDEIMKAAISDDESCKILPAGFNDIMKSYSDLPLYDLCEKIISCFGLYGYYGDSEYLRTFEDCVLDFTKTFSSDLNRFVQWWDESGCRTAIQPSDNQDAVTVMTVHKSKGLDFSIQFIPFCNWKMEDYNNQQANYIWAKCKSGTQFSKLPIVPLRYGSALANTHFAESYIEEKRNMAVDSLNLLYVALTRAVDELHIYCPKPKEKKDAKISTVGDLLYYDIINDVPNQDAKLVDLKSYLDNDGTTLLMDEKHSLETGRKIKDFKDFVMKPFGNTPWENKLAVLSHSSDFFIQNSPFLQDRINHGLLMHDVMSRIEFSEDASEALQDMIYQGRITEDQRKELAKLLDDAFEIPQVKRWFSHDWKQVINERALLTKEGNIRIPDRVLVGESETVVIDFKFGKERPEYHDQIKEYAALLQSMKYPNVKAYLYYVEDGKIVEVS